MVFRVFVEVILIFGHFYCCRQHEISESAVEIERSRFEDELKVALQTQEKQLKQVWPVTQSFSVSFL